MINYKIYQTKVWSNVEYDKLHELKIKVEMPIEYFITKTGVIYHIVTNPAYGTSLLEKVNQDMFEVKLV
jgi:hypothetical protein